ncbi:MAG TPA: DUF1269 domain-containing protein [Dehalococcoidia bacterium]|jgi:uncharacterized membrane protein|nr:DUF1269 domain-containing protein [Dehalococcoidia bacterium]
MFVRAPATASARIISLMSRAGHYAHARGPRFDGQRSTTTRTQAVRRDNGEHPPARRDTPYDFSIHILVMSMPATALHRIGKSASVRACSGGQELGSEMASAGDSNARIRRRYCQRSRRPLTGLEDRLMSGYLDPSSSARGAQQGGCSMSELVALAFDTPDAAEQMRDRLVSLQRQHLISLADAAVVKRAMDGKVKVKQATNLAGAGALGGGFWGMLIGLLFFAPWLGLAVGAVTGALAGKFSDIGVDDKFIKDVGSTIKPGNSALFLLVDQVTPDRVMEELKDFQGAKVIKTSLSKEQEQRLKDAFGAEEDAA